MGALSEMLLDGAYLNDTAHWSSVMCVSSLAQTSKINALEERSSSMENQVQGQQAEMGGMKAEIEDLKNEITGKD